MRPRSILVAVACVVGSLTLLSVPARGDAPAVDDPEAPERLVVFELFNRSESGG